jgi:elongator complex protein 5
MTSTRIFTGTNIDWEEALQRPSFIKHILPDDGTVPKWLIDLASQHLAELSRARTVGACAPPKAQPGARAPNCDGWIKKQNTYTGEIRKRRPEGRKPRGMSRPVSMVQYQRHCIHLMSKVLNIRTNASPFTLVLDDLNQRASILMNEFIRRALSRNVNVVVVSFESPGYHSAVRYIPAFGDHSGAGILTAIENAMKDSKESLVIVDSLYDLLHVKNVAMEALFSLVVGKFASTLTGIYHQDMLAEPNPDNKYAPQSIDVLKFMATSVITCKSLAHVLAAKAAKERSLPEPTHGLLQGAEGIVQSLDANDHRGIVLEAEFRHKSGRPETETFFLRDARVKDYNAPLPGMAVGTLKHEFVVLLDQVPAYGSKDLTALVNAAGNEIESTFNLGLTEKQKAAREGVVLPYFDAQKGEGGEGGRILYDMGSEDDFDEEEDEI